MVRTVLKRSLLAGMAGAAAVACGDRVETATVEIESRPLTAGEAPPRSSVESARHTIRVRQTIRVPDPCRRLQGDLLHSAGHITLRVNAVAGERECPAEETPLAYTASIRDLPSGRYRLRVVHPVERGGQPEVVLEHPVIVLERAVDVP